MLRLNNILVVVMLFFLVSCDMQKYPEPENSSQREVLIHSGMTMTEPLMEISALIEAEENCQIKITYGGSGHIFKSVEVNQIGDLFFPGDEFYIDELKNKGIITESVRVGYNQAGFFVQPGNPRELTSDLKQLGDKQLQVVIGTKKAGAIGRETERILQLAGIYQEVVDNAIYMTTDSKGLSAAIKNGYADLVMNWKAVGSLTRNIGTMEFIPISEKLTQKQPLVMGILTYSQYPDLAKKILELASSKRGQEIFHKYGFLD